MTTDRNPAVEELFLKIIGRTISDSSSADADRFVSIMEGLSQIERNRAAIYSSATEIVQAAKREMDLCGCPYHLPDTGSQLDDARRIRVIHQPGCTRHHRSVLPGNR